MKPDPMISTARQQPSYAGGSQPRDTSMIAVAALAYFFAHQLAYFFPDSQQTIMLIWPAGGIGLAAFLLNPRRLWPALTATFYVSGMAASMLMGGRPFLAALGFMAANMVESIGCALLILYNTGEFRNFNRVREVLMLITGTVLVNAISSCIGAGTSVLTLGASFADAWLSWYISDGLGILLAGPFIVAWLGVRGMLAELDAKKIVEGTAFIAIWSLAVLVIFRGIEVGPVFGLHPYLLIALLVWPALRLGMQGVTLALMMLFAIAVLSPSIVHGPSPWEAGQTDAVHRLLELQLFLGFMAVSGFLLAAVFSDRKLAEAALRESEQRLRPFLESSSVVGWLRDETERYVFLSPNFERRVGMRLENWKGKTVFEVWPREVAEESYRNDQAMLAAGKPMEVIESMVDSTGHRSWWLNHKFSFRDDSGKLYIGGLGVDITERRQAEEKARELSEQLQMQFDLMPVGLIVFENDLRVRTWNPAAERIFGFTAAEMVGRSAYGLIVPKRVKQAVDKIRARLVAGGAAANSVNENVAKDGRTITCEWINTPLKDAGGAVTGILSMVQDITARREAEQALQQERSRTERYLNTARVMLVALDDQGRVTMLNRNGHEVLGYAENELIGRNWFETVLPPEDASAVSDAYRHLISGDIEPFAYYENHVLTKGGEKRLIAWHNTVVRDDTGRIISTLSSGEDITERRQAEAERDHLQAQLLQAQKMESIGRLAGGVAHDFNNMLGAILGYTELALMQVDAGSPLQDDLAEIKRAAERSADLTRRLLAFARKQTAIPRVLDLNDTVSGMMKMLQRLIGEGIHLVWLPGVDLGLVNMDPAQIDQILANLCINARDAIKGSGKLIIETRNFVADDAYCAGNEDAEPGAYVLLAVSDTGHGMEPETMAHLFEPFFTTKGVGEGTGLGLATVYGIVRQNGGFIEVDSTPGKGTDFRIYLPRYASGEPRAPAPAMPPEYRGTETVLLVEDEPALLELASRVLEQHGYRALIARGPDQALQVAEQHQGEIHLLLSDVVMPEMNGRDLAEHLLTRYPRLKSLFMSGYSASTAARHGEPADTNFLQKPFSIHDLLAKVRAALDAGHPAHLARPARKRSGDLRKR